jgi:hypothetical protein
MSNRVRCHCQSCTIRSLTGPAAVITIGILFLLHQVRGGYFYFGNTWPVILVVIGVLQLASSIVPRDGHIEPQASVMPSPPPPPTVPPSNPPQTPYVPQGQ